MVKLLEIRSLLRVYYQKLQMIIDPLVKFLAAFITFRAINGSIGYDARMDQTAVVLLLSLLCAFTPSAVLVFLAMVVSIVHIYAAAPILALLSLLVFGILYCFFLRYASQYGYVVVAIPVLYTLNMPYLVPLLLGIFANPLAMLPSACGVAVYFLFDIIKTQTENSTEVALEEVLPLYMEVFEEIMECKQILVVAGVFALVITAVYLIRRMKMEYAAEIALLAGAVINVFGFLICDLRFGITGEIGPMLLGTLLSLALAFVALFFKRVLDYTAVENVQFEDDDYYYYVKAVPKLGIGIQERKVKQITGKSEEEEPEDEEDDYEEILDEETGEVIFVPKKQKALGGRSKQDVNRNGYLYRRQREAREQAAQAVQAVQETPMENERLEPEEIEFAEPEQPSYIEDYERERLAAKSYEAGEEDYPGAEELTHTTTEQE